MVYIRNKRVKGIDYAYLVQSVWDPKRNTSRQQTIKYLGNASQVTIEDVPQEYRNDSKILTFISAFSSLQEDKKILLSKIQEEMFLLLTDCNIGGLISLYEKYSKLFGLTEFYDKLFKPTMYRIGDLWEQGKLDVATEHASTNTAISLIKAINERIISKIKTHRISSQYKTVVCTPNGELHGLACNMIESLLLNKGFKVYNISTSVPTEYIIDYMRDLEPDIIFISITLAENIKSAERLVQQIHLKYNNKLPVVVGGSAFNSSDWNPQSKINAFLMKDASFDDIMKLVKTSTSKSIEPNG
ncbi:MAG TPA: cobalamin-dependent protein [Nitrososphaeraceae archaeon]|jgi:MerR family transcriptional regulator, light-induced transcriptional regulator